MCSDEMLHCLQRIEEKLNSDEYEYSNPYTIGGAPGTYQLSSPWNTECEWSLQAVTGNITAVSSFVLAPQNPGVTALAFNATENFGNVKNGKDSAPLVGFTGQLNTNQPFINFDAPYLPLAAPTTLYMAVGAGANGECMATVIFRRKLVRNIPDKPLQKPHTHSHPQSRRNYRTMSVGFQSQYPEEGQAYEHQDLPAQDTGVAKRGVFPLGVTDNSHRKVPRNGR